MNIEQTQNPGNPENAEGLSEVKTSTPERIKALQDKARPTAEFLKNELGDSVPQMPEQLTTQEQAQFDMAEAMGLSPEFLADTDPEQRMVSALESMRSWNDQPLRSADSNSLKASAQDLEDHNKTPGSLV